jgi:hypothetical protein
MKKLLFLFSLIFLLGIFATPAGAQQTTLVLGKNTINIASLSATDTILIPNDYKATAILGLQVVFRNVTGTPNGSFNLYQTWGDNVRYVPLGVSGLPYTLASANASVAFEKSYLPFNWMPMIITKNGMTGGYIDIYLRIKQY